MKSLITDGTAAQLINCAAPKITACDEVKVRIRRAAICRTDLYVAKGLIPSKDGQILGHEAVGEVCGVGDDALKFSLGDRVVINPLIPCLECSACHTGAYHHCADGVFLGVNAPGAFAEFVVVPERQLHFLPDGLSFDLGIYTEPIAATKAILQHLKNPKEEILVYGDGRIAELTALLLRSTGFKNLIVSAQPTKREYSTVIEALSMMDHPADLLSYTKPGGHLIVKSRHPMFLELPILHLVRKRIRITGVHYGPFSEALNFLLRNSAYIEPLLGNTWPLESYQEAFAEADSSEARKTLFTFD